MTSAIYRLSDDYIERMAALDPGAATYLGIAGHDHAMTDFSPAGHAARADHDRSTLASLNDLVADSDDDRLAAGVLREALETSVAEHGAGEHLRSIRVIAGDVDSARSVFDLMPTETAEHWATIAERLGHVPAAFAGMRESWSLGISRGVVAPRRQALAVAHQLDDWSGRGGGDGFFGPFVEQASTVAGAPIDALRRRWEMLVKLDAGAKKTRAPGRREVDYFGDGDTYTAEELTVRASMLGQLETDIQLMNNDLTILLNEIARPARQ